MIATGGNTNTCGNISHFGILSTPVVTGTTLFLVAASAAVDMQGNATSVAFTLWSVDLTTGQTLNYPGTQITPPTVAGVTFQPEREIQRPGLLLLNSVVYAAFSSSCDANPYQGWVIALDVSDPTAPVQRAAFCDSCANGGVQGGIWMSGSGLVADDTGHVYFMSGNGSAGTNDYGDTVVKLDTSAVDAGSLTVADYFTPYDEKTVSKIDLDLGVGGSTYVPGADWIIAGSKFGKVYVLNAGNVDGGMGEYATNIDSGDLNIEFPGSVNGNGACNGSPPYTWNGRFSAGGDTGRVLDVIQASCNLGSATGQGGSPDCVHDLELPCGDQAHANPGLNGLWPDLHGTPLYWPYDVNSPAGGGYLFAWGQYDWMRRYQIQPGGTFARNGNNVPMSVHESDYASGRLVLDRPAPLPGNGNVPIGYGAQIVLTTDNAGHGVVWGNTLSSPDPKADYPCLCDPSLPGCNLPPGNGIQKQPLSPCTALDPQVVVPGLANLTNSGGTGEARPGRLTAFDGLTMKILFQDGEPPYVGAKFTPVTPYKDRVFLPTLSDGVTQSAQIKVFGIDTDGDGWIDIEDNCPSVANNDQRNTNADAERALGMAPLGDACDPNASSAGSVGLAPNILRVDSFVGNASGDASSVNGTVIPLGCYCPLSAPTITDCADLYGCSIANDADLPPPYGLNMNSKWHVLTDERTGQPFQAIAATFAERDDATIRSGQYQPNPSPAPWNAAADESTLCPAPVSSSCPGGIVPIVLNAHVVSLPAGPGANVNNAYRHIAGQAPTVVPPIHLPIPRTPWMPGPVLDPDAWLPPYTLPFFVFGTTNQGTTQIIEQNGNLLNDATASWSSDALALAGGVVAGTYDAITGDDVVLGVPPGSDLPATIIVTAGTTQVVGGLRVTPGGVVSVHPSVAADPPNGPIMRAYSAHRGWLFGLSSATGQPVMTTVDVTGALRGSPHNVSRPINGVVPSSALAMAWDGVRRRLLVLDDVAQGKKHVLRLLSVLPSSASVEIWHTRPVEKLPRRVSLSLGAAGEILVSLVGVPGDQRSELLMTNADGVPLWSSDFDDRLLLPAYGSGLGIVLPFEQRAKKGSTDLDVDFKPRTELVRGICGAHWLRARVDTSSSGPLSNPRADCENEDDDGE